MWGFHDGMGWWMPFGGMWSMPFWVIVVGLVIWGVRRFSGGKTESQDTSDTALEIARMRLARGEITLEEFEDIRIGLE